MGGRFPWSNCLLLESPGATVLVDSGCGDALEAVAGRVDAVVYTHFHPDHITGHRLLRAAGRVRVYAPAGEEAYRSLDDLAKRFAPEIAGLWLGFARSLMGLQSPPEVDEYYEPGEDVCFRGVCLKTVPAPGHLRTHTLIEPGPGSLHLVDIDLSGFGPWYANPEADPHQFLEDILYVGRGEWGSYTSAHKPGVYTGEEARARLARFALRLPEAMEALLGLLPEDGEATPRELAGRGVIYRRYIEGFEAVMAYFEANMIGKLLPWLAGMGCAARGRRGWRRLRAPGDCGGLRDLRERILGSLGGPLNATP